MHAVPKLPESYRSSQRQDVASLNLFVWSLFHSNTGVHTNTHSTVKKASVYRMGVASTPHIFSTKNNAAHAGLSDSLSILVSLIDVYLFTPDHIYHYITVWSPAAPAATEMQLQITSWHIQVVDDVSSELATDKRCRMRRKV